MRKIAAFAIALAILAGLGFTAYVTGGTAAPGASPTISILDLHRNHPGLKVMPVEEPPMP